MHVGTFLGCILSVSLFCSILGVSGRVNESVFNVPLTAEAIWRWDHGLVSSDRLEEPGIKLETPGYKATTPRLLLCLAEVP